MTALDLSSAPSPLTKQSPDPIPALLLGRLAVDGAYSGVGVGTALVGHVLVTTVELNQRAACKAVVVNAVNEHALRWWEHLGFHRFDDPQGLDLYLLTSEIERILVGLSDPYAGN